MTPSGPLLFTYTIPIDDGAAPNPFRAMCSLAICKPGIRRTARKGDWVAGLGSKNTQRSGDLSGRLVYAMHVDDVLSLEEYDRRAPAEWPHRIPNAGSADLTERLGTAFTIIPVERPFRAPASMARRTSRPTLVAKMSLYRVTFIISGAGQFPFLTRSLAFATRPRGTRAKPMLRILRDL
jgi:Nucleotide modification associated domain 2